MLKHGEVVESGTYAELLQNNGDFSELIRQHQFADGNESADDEGIQTAQNVHDSIFWNKDFFQKFFFKLLKMGYNCNSRL